MPDSEVPVATDPDGLWQAGEDSYLTDDEIQKKLEARERNRFVTVYDESGHPVTQTVDMVEAREAAQARARHKDYQEIDGPPEVEQGEIAVRADCCADGVVNAPVLAPGDEEVLDFAARGHTVKLAGLHPAVTLRLAPDVAALRLRTWLTGDGYVHPQVMLLDASGIPLSLIHSPFSRRYPETWRSHSWLEGDVPIPEEAYAVVFFLSYANIAERQLHISQGASWQEPGQELRLRGEVTVRGLEQ